MPFGVEQELERLERSLLQPEVRRSEAVVDLLAEDFLEFGSSGRVYTKAQVLEALRAETPVDFTVSDLKVQLLESDVGVVTYRALRHSHPPVHTLRSSIWERREGRWQMTHHLGATTP